MQLYLYNSLTKRKSAFTPINSSKIGMYVCGPTVYDYPHLGNALAVVIYDVLFRLLRHIYGEKQVVYVRNITDVDDKIIIAAKAKNMSIAQLTKQVTEIFQDNIEKLNCLAPNFEPKATAHIAEMIAMINSLIDKDYAYKINGNVYFRVNKFADYSNLSGKKIADLVAGARVEIDNDKENPEDFALWKASADEDNSFKSPFGLGRPGWHIECSAMSQKYLGNDFDIHGGGVDLIFPHHTNEIAQSCCAHEGSKYAHYWVHNGFLTVNGEKMSKSLGNFITIAELLERGIHGEVIRYVLLSSHYHKPIDWNDKVLHDAQKALDSFYRVLQQESLEECEVPAEFLATLLDDLNTPQSFALMHEYAYLYNKNKDKQAAAKLKASGQFLGFFECDAKKWFNDTKLDAEYIEEQIKQRHLAKAQKNWQLADQIRDNLKNLGIILEDKPDGSCSWRKG